MTGIRHGRRLAGRSRTASYRSGRSADETALRMRISEIAFTRPRLGVSRLLTLLWREGCHLNSPDIS